MKCSPIASQPETSLRAHHCALSNEAAVTPGLLYRVYIVLSRSVRNCGRLLAATDDPFSLLADTSILTEIESNLTLGWGNSRLRSHIPQV